MSKKAASDNTLEKQSGLTPWKAGQSGNPAGRPKGSRNRLAGEFIEGLADEFEQYGQEAIRRVREKDPSTFLKIISNVLPKQFETTLNMNILVEFENARDFAAAWEVVKRAREMIGAMPLESPMIDIEPQRRDAEFDD